MVSLIMLREFIITGLRLYGLNKGVVLEAKKFGKHKTFSQIIGILIIFIIIILNKKFSENFVVFFLYYKFIPILMWYIVSITLFSGIYYFWINRRAIKTL